MPKHFFPQTESFQKVWQKIIGSIADIFFPQTCFGCGTPSSWLCQNCESKIPLLRTQTCFHCQKVTTRYGEACFECQNQLSESPLDAVFAATCYHVPVIKRMIHTYKYQFVDSLGETLGKLLAKAVETSNLPLPTILVPVPLHNKRLKYRGFNQVALLAKILVTNFSVLEEKNISQIITRNRYTKPQQKTHSKEERVDNLKNAFQLLSTFASPATPLDLRNQVAWLIDDVATTHSTLTACAQTLKDAGVKKVYAVVLAQD